MMTESDDAIASLATRRFGAIETFRETLHLAWTGRWAWLRLSLIPIILHLVLFAFELVALIRAGDATGGAPLDVEALFGISASTSWPQVLAALSLVPAATAWIRAVVEGGLPARLHYRIGTRELDYLIRYILLTALGGLALIGVAAVLLGLGKFLTQVWHVAPESLAWAMPFALVSFFGAAFAVTATLILCLPAAALDEDSRFRTAMARSAGHRLPLLGLALLTLLASALVSLALFVPPAALVAWGLVSISDPATATAGDFRPFARLVAGGFGMLIAWLGSVLVQTLLFATALACAYRRVRAAAA